MQQKTRELHIAPKEGQWEVKWADEAVPAEMFQSRDKALQRGKEMAEKEGAVYIEHDVNGRIVATQKEFIHNQ